MSGIPFFNFPAFAKKTKELRAAGHFVISPAEMDEDIGFHPVRDAYIANTEAFKISCLERDVKAIIQVDAIVLLEGYEDSKGVAFEIAAARFLGRRIFFPGEQVPRDIKDNTLFNGFRRNQLLLTGQNG